MAGRFRMCSAALCTSIAEELFIISRLSRSAERSKRISTGGVVKANGICSTLQGSPSQALTRQLSQRESLWQSTQTSSLCQGLSLWERWHRAAMTERARPLAGYFLKFSLPCNNSRRSTVCSTGKVSEFCPAAEGRKADRMPVLGRKSCAFCRF